MSNTNLDQVMGTLRNLGRINQTGNGEGTQRSTTLYYKLPKTTQRIKIRILPNKDNPSDFPGRMVASHFKLPIARKDEKDFGTRRCLAIHGMNCEICNVLNKFSSMGLDTSMWQRAIQGKFDTRILSDPSQPDVKPTEVRIMTATEGMLSWLAESFKKSNGVLFDPIVGRNIDVHREKVDGKVICEYEMDPSPISNVKADLEMILNQRHDLDKIFKNPTDNDINENREVAQAMERSLSEKLKLITGRTSDSNPYNSPSPISESQPQSVTSPQTNLNANPNKPPQAPNCFGDAKVFAETKAECMNCVWDFQCKKNLK